MQQVQKTLEEIDKKLDYVVERQEFTEELITEMTPVAREAMNAMAENLADWERRGYFAMLREFGGMLDRLSQAYGPDDIHQLSDQVVQIVDTVRNLTQPDVLDLANEATDVLHHGDEVEPVGIFKVMKATSGDEDVRRGMAMALELLRHLGRTRGGEGVDVRPAKATAAEGAPEPAAPAQNVVPIRRTVRDLPPPPKPIAPPSPGEPVLWEGREFTAEGFLMNPDGWDEELAKKLAAGLGLLLEEDHWTVLHWARADYLEHGASPNVRRVAVGSEVGTRRMYELFPRTPGKTTAILAGIPKPVGCV